MVKHQIYTVHINQIFEQILVSDFGDVHSCQ